MIPTPPVVIHDTASASRRAADRNLAAECRAVEAGHNCRLDLARGVFIVKSDSNHSRQYALTASAVDGKARFSCTPESLDFSPIPRGIMRHARQVPLGCTGCLHSAVVARRLEREGLLRWENGLWLSTEKSEALVGEAT